MTNSLFHVDFLHFVLNYHKWLINRGIYTAFTNRFRFNMDDDFLTKCFEGHTASVELVLRIVLEKPDLKVLDVRTQVFVENLLNRSVRLDVLATDDTPIGKLMHDFSCTDPAEMYYETLAERARFFKESKEGVSIMCKVMEDMRNESLREGIRQGSEQGRKEMAVRMLEAGKYAVEEIAEISGLSLEEVKQLDAGQIS